MSKWKPETYTEDPTVNALLNIAAGLFALSEAANSEILAESIEEGLKKIADRPPEGSILTDINRIAAASEEIANNTKEMVGVVESLTGAIEDVDLTLENQLPARAS